MTTGRTKFFKRFATSGGRKRVVNGVVREAFPKAVAEYGGEEGRSVGGVSVSVAEIYTDNVMNSDTASTTWSTQIQLFSLPSVYVST